MKREYSLIVVLAAAAWMGALCGCELGRPHLPSANSDLATSIDSATIAAQLHHPYLMKDLVGDDLGPTGGYLLAATPEKFDQHKQQEAVAASRNAEQSPASVADARNSTTADLNGDGYVTMDEVVALKHAGLSDAEIVNRLRNTNQVFSLTPEQEHYLTDRGVSHDVVKNIYDLARAAATPATMAGQSTTQPATTQPDLQR